MKCFDCEDWPGICETCEKICECCGGTYYDGTQNGCLCCFSECCGGEEYFKEKGRCGAYH